VPNAAIDCEEREEHFIWRELQIHTEALRKMAFFTPKNTERLPDSLPYVRGPYRQIVFVCLSFSCTAALSGGPAITYSILTA